MDHPLQILEKRFSRDNGETDGEILDTRVAEQRADKNDWEELEKTWRIFEGDPYTERR